MEFDTLHFKFGNVTFKEDIRGTIVKFKLGLDKFLVIYSKKGALRAGEIHNVIQYTFLLKGKIEVITKKQKNVDVHNIYEGSQSIAIPKGIPHYFKFLEDSIMIEIEEENMTTEYYPEYRKLVEKSLIDNH